LKREIDTLGRQSYRDRHKILRLALTLAAWDGHSEPLAQHILEARAYRDFPLA
jgi:predicted ATPase with chaperone activity